MINLYITKKDNRVYIKLMEDYLEGWEVIENDDRVIDNDDNIKYLTF